MTIADMHIWFRQYAQQMGMQNVRAILPEQIDLLINTSITDTVNQIIQQNIAVTNDRIITDNSKIGQVNALKTLYKVSNLHILNAYGYSQTNQGSISFSFNPSDVHYTMSFTFSPFFEEEKEKEIVIECTATTVDSLNAQINAALGNVKIGGYTPIFNANSVTITSTGGISFKLITNVPVEVGVKAYGSGYTTDDVVPTTRLFAMTSDDINKGKLSCYGLLSDYLYLVDFSIDYKTCADSGLPIGSYDEPRDDVNYASADAFTTTYFPIRLIDDIFLSDCLNDFINAPKLRSPIMTVNNETFDIYFDKVFVKNYYAKLDNGLLPYTLRFSYLEKPAIVKKSADINGANVDCNLPEYLHVDILKHAVDLYRASINGGMLAQQGQDQNQQREIARNTAVPSNGYNQ